MLSLPPSVKAYVASDATDMRKSIDALSLIAQETLNKDPFSGHLFVFCNKRGDKVKILYWDRNGFCLWYKRLERGVFRLPKMKSKVFMIMPNELNLLLEGIDLTDRNRLCSTTVDTIK
ncbi:MAG: IS66 family insertion sequence element accessory protein TnpB [Bdellovibrionales bacterium]|jgi:transposase|nr:IS66 family insertion sequence element accessory protein TnpB [Bdellovibrionales bacterium]